MSENSLIPSEQELSSYQLIAKKAADSQFFNKIGGEGGLLSMMLYARELRIGPMEALFGGMNNIMGKVEISPRLMNKMIRQAGHKLDILKSSSVECSIKGERSDTGETYTADFTIEDAKKAGIYKEGGGWTKYPADMLFARALSRLARRLFADVISTAYVEGEISQEAKKEPKKKEEPQTVTLDEAEAIIIEEEVSEPANEEIEESFWEAIPLDYKAEDVKDFIQFSAIKKKKPEVATMKEATENLDKFLEGLNKFIDKKKSQVA